MRKYIMIKIYILQAIAGFVTSVQQSSFVGIIIYNNEQRLKYYLILVNNGLMSLIFLVPNDYSIIHLIVTGKECFRTHLEMISTILLSKSFPNKLKSLSTKFTRIYRRVPLK